MQDRVHRRISKQVGELLDPSQNWEILIAASVAPDWKLSGMGHHRKRDPMEDIGPIMELLHSARRASLHDKFSDEFQESMGKAFHFIQDRFIQSTDRSLHAAFEAAISRALPSLLPWGRAIPLEGDGEVESYLRNEVKFIKDPTELLDQAFFVCLSIAKAVCENERGFKAGADARRLLRTLCNQMSILFSESRGWLDGLNATLGDIASFARARYDSIRKDYLHGVMKRTSFAGKLRSFLFFEDWRYRRKLKGIRKEFAEKIEKLSSDRSAALDALNRKQESSVRKTIKALEKILESKYDNEYRIRRLSPLWYGIESIADFKSPEEIRLSIAASKEQLGKIFEEWELFTLNMEKEKQDVDKALMSLSEHLLMPEKQDSCPDIA
jgi:hypothetical protein